jgi:endonuclease/exonuclease/phosphatase family metal-dependent hydrolase
MIVVVWNMAKRRAAWSHLLGGLGPDLALLQETPYLPDPPCAGQLLHDAAYPGPSLGSAVYVREGAARPLVLRPEHRVWFMAAEVELPGGSQMVAVSIHTPTVPSVRPWVDDAFDALAPLLEGRSFVVGGDFNLSRNYDNVYGTTHHGEFLDGLPARGFVDCMRKFHREEQRTFWGRTKHPYQNDHVFVSDDLADRVVACEVADRAGASDHSPLKIELDVALRASS